MSSLQIGTNDGVERHLPPPPVTKSNTDDETYRDSTDSISSLQNDLSPPPNNNPYNPYNPYNNNNISRTSQNSEDSARSNDNLFRDFKSTDKSLPSPPKNYNTYPQTTELN